MKLFVHHLRGMNGILFLKEHLNVLEEFLNSTISLGVIFVRVSSTAEEEIIPLIKPNVDLNYLHVLTSMPNIFNSGGLSAERKLYLYGHVQPFCSDKFKKPTLPTCQLI